MMTPINPNYLCLRESTRNPDVIIRAVKWALITDDGVSHRVSTLAERFFISPRTLNRRLAIAGSSFRKITEIVRREKAEIYLRETDLKISEIARQLGYSDASNFSKAFKLWTGSTPRRYRASTVRGASG